MAVMVHYKNGNKVEDAHLTESVNKLCHSAEQFLDDYKKVISQYDILRLNQVKEVTGEEVTRLEKLLDDIDFLM